MRHYHRPHPAFFLHVRHRRSNHNMAIIITTTDGPKPGPTTIAIIPGMTGVTIMDSVALTLICARHPHKIPTLITVINPVTVIMTVVVVEMETIVTTSVLPRVISLSV